MLLLLLLFTSPFTFKPNMDIRLAGVYFYELDNRAIHRKVIKLR
jgi:hypothetical protein